MDQLSGSNYQKDAADIWSKLFRVEIVVWLREASNASVVMSAEHRLRLAYGKPCALPIAHSAAPPCTIPSS